MHKETQFKCFVFALSPSDFLPSVITFCSSSVPGYWLCNREMRRGRRGGTWREEEEGSRDSAQWAGTFSPLWPGLGDRQQVEEGEDEGGRQDIWNKLEGSKTHGEIREKRPTVQRKREKKEVEREEAYM